MRLIERIWSGGSPPDRIARAALSPLEMLYKAGTAVRSRMYDSGIAPVRSSSVPVVSVGNLTVGGTGKTPVSAWIAGTLLQHGLKPAIVLRGYGGDEPLVHSRMNPGVPVIVSPERSEGIAMAANNGADVVVLDDGFQHRRAGRDLDFVLVSADDWTGRTRLLPAGPFREPMTALKRASAVLVTRKAATDEGVARVVDAVRVHSGVAPIAVLRLALSEIVREPSEVERRPAETLAGKTVLAIAAVGNPGAFFLQLELIGARAIAFPFPDHHSFNAGDVATIMQRSAGADYVVCTLKDVVKLGQLWPAGNMPLWYVSLAVKPERGETAIADLLMRLKGRIGVN